MRINNFTLNFKGYDAQKIKALYMQEPSAETQKLIYEELYNIGKREGIDVFIHSQKNLIDHPVHLLYSKEKNTLGCDYWAQDNKILLNNNGNTEILVLKNYFKNPDFDEPKFLAEKTGFKLKETPLVIEGGNIFLGKKDNDENYLIVGKDTILRSALLFFFENLGFNEINPADMTNFTNKGKMVYTDEETKKKKVIKFNEFNKDWDYWKERAKEKFCEEFGVKKENLTIISQPNYHIDLGIRPLEYPYVLVNDLEILKSNLERVEKEIKNNKYSFLKPFKKELNELEKYYVHSSIIADELRSAGFVPVMVGGGYSFKNVNFINSIVNKRKNGISYITNSTVCNDKRYEIFQNIFQDEINKKYPNIDRFYFVEGAQCKEGRNLMMQYLDKLHGGVHCLCAEEVDCK